MSKQSDQSIFETIPGEYSRGRSDWPRSVFDLVSGAVARRSDVLDLGCGTGISTRQLADSGYQVVGADVSQSMINQAFSDSEAVDVRYVVASADDLPFDSQAFHCVTAFNSFHWFDRDEVVGEVMRVLRPSGVVLIVDEFDLGGLKVTLKDTLSKFVTPPPRTDYRPSRTWSRKVGSNSIEVRKITTEHHFTLYGAMLYAQSHSWWPLVPLGLRAEALVALRSRFERELESGKTLTRNITIEVTIVSP